MKLLSILDIPLKGKKVLIRTDLNVPIKSGRVVSSARIKAALKTIQYALKQDASVILMSHLGRPEEGIRSEKLSLLPVAQRLMEMLGLPVILEKNYLDGCISVSPGRVVLCENVRFNLGEKTSDNILSRKLASLCDVFVMDAFATSHRAQASTYGVAKYAPIACAGLLLKDEINALSSVIKTPPKPLLAIVGGSKVSTKLTILETLIEKVDQLIIGGGIANTFLAATGLKIGKSLIESDLVEKARELILKAKSRSVQIPLPVDVRVATSFDEHAKSQVKNVNDVSPNEMILDVGPETEKMFARKIKVAKTILWNGPVGVFEFPNFSKGTETISVAVAHSDAFSVAGGGDTIAAIERFDVKQKISYISTAGGAFLEFIEGKALPGIEVLYQRWNKD
jgi:phosphoglycerate kinase